MRSRKATTPTSAKNNPRKINAAFSMPMPKAATVAPKTISKNEIVSFTSALSTVLEASPEWNAKPESEFGILSVAPPVPDHFSNG